MSDFMDNRLKISCIITTQTHDLNESAFELLLTDKSNLIVSNITNNRFELSAINFQANIIDIKSFIPIAHNQLNFFLMALNITSLGYFAFLNIYNRNLVYRYIDTSENNSNGFLHFNNQINLKSFGNKRVLSKNDIDNASMLYTSLIDFGSLIFKEEYLKGIFHLSSSFADINFDKEAFSNFYRCFEFAITQLVLKKEKLSNEKKEIIDALKKLKISEDVIDEFNSLYKIRSEQIMHSQKIQHRLSQDEAIKMKILLDAVLFIYFRPIWENKLKIMAT